MKRMSRVEWDIEMRRCAEAGARAMQVYQGDKRSVSEIADEVLRRGFATPEEFFGDFCLPRGVQ